jgi:hypothetical protein
MKIDLREIEWEYINVMNRIGSVFSEPIFDKFFQPIFLVI